MKHSSILRFAAASLLGIAAWGALAAGSAALEQRLAAVETLIERSSAARQVEASGVPAALEKREGARALHREARAAFAAGDEARAAALLPQASARMFEAVRLAAPADVNAGKRKAELDARLESARSLLAAQRRIAAEKGAPRGEETSEAIARLIAAAERDAAAGSLDAAGAGAEQAYLLAKAAIGSMRGGDTLVRSLTFATKEEEYAYELDRNDTHRMLLKVLVDSGKGTAPGPALDRAVELRSRGEASARAGDAASGIRYLEESTRELVRAIRAAGVYIPG
jgi:hypothetical protein